MIDESKINNLPSSIGIYLFKKRNEILYIGKSVNIKARVKSHLENAKLNKKEYLIVSQADKIETITVDSEFEALVLESKLIKKYHPKYNIIWKDDKSYLYIKITANDRYPKIFLTRKHDIDKEKNENNLYFGPFYSSKIVSELLSAIRQIVPFCTEKKISKNPCFYSKINLCHPCPNFIESLDNQKIKNDLTKEYQKNIKKIISIFQGKIKMILDDFYQQLKKLSKKEKFEEAIIIRDKIQRLERLINHPIRNEDNYENINSLTILFKELKKYFSDLKKLKRIECFDISNLNDKNQVASMVVMTNGRIDKKQYRKFKIKNQNLKSDFERINEVLKRRLKNKDWPNPDLIIIDGGKPQLKVVIDVLRNFNKDIPVLGIAKNPDRLIIGNENFLTVKYPQTNKGFNLIRLLRDEAHRFAKKYHLKLRRKDFLI
ncbi:MAG: excinuclease ABC subunit UvrC [Candidatus Microgenomates bacterium]